MNNEALKFQPLIIGAMRLGEWGAKLSTKELTHFIDRCAALGLTDFDHADIYGDYSTEEEFGEALKARPDLAQKMEITTKCGIKMKSSRRPNHKIKSYDSTADHIIKSVEESLTALHVEQIKLLLLHRPDFLLNPHDVAAAVDQLKKTGKIKHFGVSNFSNVEIEKLSSYVKVENNQIEYSIAHLAPLSDGTLDKAWINEVQITAWSPLGGGEMFATNPPPRVAKIIKVATQIGLKYNSSYDKVLLAWVRKHPIGIIPVLGSSSFTRIKDYFESLDLVLSHEEWYALLEATRGYEVA
jgi:predicted oxidoreductase